MEGGCGPTRGFGNTAKALSFGSIAQSSREGRTPRYRDTAIYAKISYASCKPRSVRYGSI
jgi:hypothetical protein